MTYAIVSIICGLIASVAFAKFMKRQLDRHHPSVDDEGEIETILARCLAEELRA